MSMKLRWPNIARQEDKISTFIIIDSEKWAINFSRLFPSAEDSSSLKYLSLYRLLELQTKTKSTRKRLSKRREGDVTVLWTILTLLRRRQHCCQAFYIKFNVVGCIDAWFSPNRSKAIHHVYRDFFLSRRVKTFSTLSWRWEGKLVWCNSVQHATLCNATSNTAFLSQNYHRDNSSRERKIHSLKKV